MLKHLLLIPLAALFCHTAQAQFLYTFKDTTTAYTPLTGGTSVNGSVIWDDEDFTTPLPFTWKIDSTITVTNFELLLGLPAMLSDITNLGDLNGFLLGDIDVADRGMLTGTTSLSPIRYTTTGTTPNRIFKLEVANAGFYNEYDLYGTMGDSITFQVWVYETKNIVEMHFGPSRLNHAGDYWGYNLFGTGPLFGYGKHVDLDMYSTGSIYHLQGNPAAPAIDTFSFATATAAPIGLSAWPANGKVYRFTPKSASCAPPVANFSAGTPSGRTVQYSYNGTIAALDSLVWDFGDGQKQKITTGFANPLSHTFTSNGRYNVCVTAYSICGSNNVCKQTPLAVGSLAALGNVQVYPNPAKDLLTIEGMQAGDKAAVLSIIGQQVLSTTISNSRQIINLSTLPAGTYMLTLTNKDGVSGAVRITKQ